MSKDRDNKILRMPAPGPPGEDELAEFTLSIGGQRLKITYDVEDVTDAPQAEVRPMPKR